MQTIGTDHGLEGRNSMASNRHGEVDKCLGRIDLTAIFGKSCVKRRSTGMHYVPSPRLTGVHCHYKVRREFPIACDENEVVYEAHKKL